MTTNGRVFCWGGVPSGVPRGTLRGTSGSGSCRSGYGWSWLGRFRGGLRGSSGLTGASRRLLVFRMTRSRCGGGTG